MRLNAPATSQFLKKLTFLLREMHRQHNFYARIEIAASLAAQVRHPLASQAECAVILSFGRDGEDQLTPIWHRYLHFTAEHRLDQFHLHIRVEVVSLALKCGIGLDANHQKEVAARAATNPRLPFACDANL